jgi:hypothetical protein
MMRPRHPANTRSAGANATFAVTQVRLDNDGRIADVWWSRVDATSHRPGEGSVTAPVSAVVHAIRAGTSVISRPPGSDDEARDRRYVVADLPDGPPTIVLEDAAPRRSIAGSADSIDPGSASRRARWARR